MKRKTVKCVMMFSIVSLMLTSCRQNAKIPVANNYKTEKARVTSITLNREFTATIEGDQVVEIRPQVSGKITSICVDEGAKVSKGQTLFIIDQAPYKDALRQAESQVSNARASLDNYKLTLQSKKELRKENVVSEFDLQQAQNQVKQAQATLQNATAQVAAARTNLGYTVIKSPTSGVISMINYRVGALVSSTDATPLTVVSNDTQMRAYFSVSENFLQELTGRFGSTEKAIQAMGQVQLKLINGTLYQHTGKVNAMSGNIDNATGSIAFRAVFSNPEGVLRSGSQGTVIIPYIIKDKIVIPQEATFELQDKIFVYKVVNGKAKSQEIKVLDHDDGTHYVVLSGLEVGDTYIAEGAGLVREGTEVK